MKILQAAATLVFLGPGDAHASPDDIPEPAELGPLSLIEHAARQCYRSEPPFPGNDLVAGLAQQHDFVLRLVENHHDAMLEFGWAAFDITCDRGVSHEFVRHRLCSFAQESSRFCNYSNGRFGGQIAVINPFEYLPEPWNYKAGHPVYDYWKEACESAERDYLDLIDEGVNAQTARAVLPTCLATHLTVAANHREWRHFLSLRDSPKAHPQMRFIAAAIRSALQTAVPLLYDTETTHETR